MCSRFGFLSVLTAKAMKFRIGTRASTVTLMTSITYDHLFPLNYSAFFSKTKMVSVSLSVKDTITTVINTKAQ